MNSYDLTLKVKRHEKLRSGSGMTSFYNKLGVFEFACPS